MTDSFRLDTGFAWYFWRTKWEANWRLNWGRNGGKWRSPIGSTGNRRKCRGLGTKGGNWRWRMERNGVGIIKSRFLDLSGTSRHLDREPLAGQPCAVGPGFRDW